MSKIREYIFNAETLQYEYREVSVWEKTWRTGLFALAVAAMMVLFCYIYFGVLGLDLPKTARLKKENAEWESRYGVIANDLDRFENTLSGIELRDDDVYRSIFGLGTIPEEVKRSGFGGVNRYAYLDELGGSQLLKDMVRREDILAKRSFLQTKALDEILIVGRQAENMSSCIPAVPPINPQKGTFSISSPFGTRIDPVRHKRAYHEGVDFATKLGNPVHVTGDGVVEKVRRQFRGYGNEVVVDHGFGYKTRYAHLNCIDVEPGQVLKRGDRIGEVGNTGKSTGPHLHYEVIYMGKQVNPAGFYDLGMDADAFSAMVEKNENTEEI